MDAVRQSDWTEALLGLFRRPRGGTDWHAGLRNTESGALLLFLFVLPLFESPKTIVLVVFLVAAGIRLGLEGRLWRRPDAIEGSVIAFLLLCIAGSTLAAATDDTGRPFGKFRELHYVVEACLLFLFVYRGGYAPRQRLLMLAVLIAGTVPAALRGQWLVMNGAPGEVFLPAIGASNSSAMYVAVILGIAVGFLLGGWRELGTAARVALFALIVAGLGLLLDMLSRGALFAFFVLMAVIVLLRRSRWALLALAGLAIGTAAWSVLALPDLAERFAAMEFDSLKSALGPRWEYERVSIAAGLEHPLLGIGTGNYKRQDFAAYGLDLDASSGILIAGQSHSLLLGRFAEEGVLGLAAFVLFLALTARALWRNRHVGEGPLRVLWYAGLSAWVVMVAHGFFLDTFDREKGQLVFFLLALSLAPLPQREAEARSRSSDSMISAASARPR